MEFKGIQHAIDALTRSEASTPSGNGVAGASGNGSSLSQNPSIHPPPSAALHTALPPKLEIPWGDFHQGWWRNFAALLIDPRAPSNFLEGGAFRDSWVANRVPARAVLAAALWHVAFLLAPFSLLPGLQPKKFLFQNTEITWQGRIDDLPLVEIPKQQPQPKARPNSRHPALIQEPAEAFHPRQRIFTDPVHPTHPRQTLINPIAPAATPKLLPTLPNMVLFQQAVTPARPKPQITEAMLKQLRPRERAAAMNAVPLSAPNLEQHLAEVSLPTMQNGPARPKMELNAGGAPRVARPARSREAGPAPDVAELTAANGGTTALIALSAAPAPPAPGTPPAGNAAAKVSLAPDAKPGSTAISANARGSSAAGNPVGVSISGGNPSASPTASGSGAAKPSAPAPRQLITRPEPKQSSEEAAERTSPPDFASLPPSAKPEVIFASRRVYTMNVNMPNMNSATGSWILNFSELQGNQRAHIASTDALSGPVPLKKVDPRYPPDLKKERVEGEVLLYAVIRRDGSVDSIQLIRGIDPQLDANAVSALHQWKFRPAEKAGAAVEVEAIVHIPFRLPEFP
jgi:TonB family protein